MGKILIFFLAFLGCFSLWAVPTDGLAGYWKGDGTAEDFSFYEKDGTLVGDTTYDTGYFGQAFKFDGSEDYVRIGNHSNLNFTSAMSVSAWINPQGPGSSPTWGGMIINKENSYEIARAQNGNIIWAFANSTPGWNWIDTGINTALNTWSHITLTYAGGVVKTYLNGVLQHTYNGSGNITVTSQQFWIGAREGGGQRFHGLIDEVAVYNRALSSSEATEAMMSNIPEPGSFLLLSFSLLSGVLVIYKNRRKN